MVTIRFEMVSAAIQRAEALEDPNIQNSLEKGHEFRQRIVLADKLLTKDEKSLALKVLVGGLDIIKIYSNEGKKRICENCQNECLATSYCEHCIKNYLKENFSNWTSGNDDVDNLIQQCQMKTLSPHRIAEWIPFSNLQNIKYLTKGGCSEIYTAVRIDGSYIEWDSKKKQLIKFGQFKVVLKKLENVESVNKSWFEEGISHLHLSSRSGFIVGCHGLTQDPLNGNYMLVLNRMDINLREYLNQNHNKLTWKERIQIVHFIVKAIFFIHKENAIHRDLHSGNILFNRDNQGFYISDLGFCGPANIPLNSIYVNGMRPKIVPGTPLEYKELMVQCWDANITKRPNIEFLYNKISNIYRLYSQNENYGQVVNTCNSQLNSNFSVSSSSTNNSFFENFSLSSSNWNFSSRVYSFENLPEPRNATEEEQEVYHSIQYDFDLQDNLIIEGKSNKRICFNDDEKDLIATSNKKVKSNNNEETQ
ncbi:kinase-like domain-containing protein [Rhizophagus clarus]|uniref:Kinase-like domain-containing protein n=1 Tax=Rhizophagus clarus TaxID=94130 RepID=A0A8H3QE02_9GLOM|nr:kinase-like domain-containing protein [Rhizophagus clarus]